MKKLKNLLYLLLVIPGTTLAISSDDVKPVDTVNGTTNITTILVRIINFFLEFAAAIAVLFIVIGGILYMTSGGNDDKTKKARSMLLAAVIGLIIVLLSLVLVNFTKSVVNKIF